MKHVLLCVALFCTSSLESVIEEKLSMPIANITKPDTYLCYAVPVNTMPSGSIVGYQVYSKKNVAHHVSIAVCQGYESDTPLWDCREQQGSICIDRVVSIGGKEGFQNEYAEMDLPEDIGVEIGPRTGLDYLILQVHYKSQSTAEDLIYPTVNLTLKLIEGRRPYRMQKMILISLGYIPASSIFSSEIAFKWTGQRIQAITYVIHTHNYGQMVEGYLIKKGVVSLIGRKKVTGHANPEYDIEGSMFIEYGDIIAARCIYRNNETFPVKFGVRNQDEMCNFAITFKYRSDDSLTYPMVIIQSQNAQNSTWCADVIPGTNVLCKQSEIMNSNM